MHATMTLFSKFLFMLGLYFLFVFVEMIVNRKDYDYILVDG